MMTLLAVERFNEVAERHTVQQTAWSATLTSSNSEINIKYSQAIKEKLIEKRKLRKLWQTNRCYSLEKQIKSCY